jgi:hypothetical protein
MMRPSWWVKIYFGQLDDATGRCHIVLESSKWQMVVISHRAKDDNSNCHGTDRGPCIRNTV